MTEIEKNQTSEGKQLTIDSFHSMVRRVREAEIIQRPIERRRVYVRAVRDGIKILLASNEEKERVEEEFRGLTKDDPDCARSVYNTFLAAKLVKASVLRKWLKLPERGPVLLRKETKDISKLSVPVRVFSLVRNFLPLR